jgi:mannitol operon repressor
MADDSQKVDFGFPAPRPFDVTHPHLKDFSEFLDEFNKETERGAALAAAAFLDDLLGRIIFNFLIPNDSGHALLDGFNAPFGTLSSRMAACHAMGLISEAEYRESEVVRKVRNEFAHKVKMSFVNDRVRSLCATMKFSVPGEKSPRGQFTSAAIMLVMNLTNRPHYVSQRSLKYGEWKI